VFSESATLLLVVSILKIVLLLFLAKTKSVAEPVWDIKILLPVTVSFPVIMEKLPLKLSKIKLAAPPKAKLLLY
jgi:hypothetical protein